MGRRNEFWGSPKPWQELLLYLRYSVTSLCRALWHKMFTATGRLAIWAGKTSTCTARAVVLPPNPCGPMPRN